MPRPLTGPVAAAAGLAVLLLAGCTTPGTAPTPQQPAAVSPAGSVSAEQAAHTPTPRSTPTPTVPPRTATASPVPSAPTHAATVTAFDRSARSLDDPASLWVVVDKKRPLRPKTWVPTDLVTPAVPHTNTPQLRRTAAAALVAMFAAAKRDGITLVSLSAYRSYATQTSIFDRNTRQLGSAATLRLTAKPGYSEHQTGLADDLGDGSSCDLQVCFESHAAARWLAKNSWRSGWILRYPLGYTAVTGIQTEPWHFRYVGKGLAKQLHTTGTKTLEQFFDLPPSPTY